MDILHFVYPSSVDRHSGDCALSFYAHSQKIFCFNTCFQFSWQSKSETAWLHGISHNTAMRNSVYNFLCNYQTIFTVAISFYTSNQQCMRVQISSHPHPYLFSFKFYNNYPSGCKVNSHCGSALHSLMTNSVIHSVVSLRLQGLQPARLL